jgi:VAD1 Analog of StAR-related lipid transfer domain/GRAM domain
MISHRRAKSQTSLTHQPSKLSNSVLAPLTPTTEEAKTPAIRTSDSRNANPGGGFFSSWVSAAQTAASTLTNTLNTQNRNRYATSSSEPEKAPISEEKVDSTSSEAEPETPKKQLAVETLGTGDLSFSHLGLDIVGSGEEKPPPSLRTDLEELRKNSTVRKDEAAAKIEDMLAKRAVSAAYEKYAHTPVAEIPDPMNMKHTSSMSAVMGGDHNDTNGSIFESETGSVRRNNSVRSRMAKRRSRGSSGATGASAIGAMIGASTTTLANPAAGPRLTGFAVAPKQRNRAFHQLFRSVPEDDYLIEDYSCALQRDILLAGRIYISQGHICFSSNILGWVTTLVISFEEVVSFEKETTAMVFPNAIAIQTLHARHTFRSLLSREATFDLLIGIWKASHPAAFQKSINGKQMEQEAQDKAEKIAESEAESDAGSEEDEVYDEDEDGDVAGSFVEVNGSIAGSDTTELKSITRKPSALNGSLATSTTLINGETLPGEKAATAAADAATDFPGPASHAPTDCSDSVTHYEKIIKDEIIPAPLGKIYSMLYGPASGVFVSKYLNDECKVTELVFEDDKKGLSNDNTTRQYTYIKPLGGSIGPKQTKCITTETLDAFDLEKAVSVTCTTQTPDVPSGSSFSVKTRYCLSWAPNNATRLQMNCGIEWTTKSWLKGKD